MCWSVFCFRRFGRKFVKCVWSVFLEAPFFLFAEKKRAWCLRVSSYVMISNKSGRFIISNHATSMNPPPLPLPIWLVVYLPLWKIWVRQLGLLFRIYGKMFQTTNQLLCSDVRVTSSQFAFFSYITSPRCSDMAGERQISQWIVIIHNES